MRSRFRTLHSTRTWVDWFPETCENLRGRRALRSRRLRMSRLSLAPHRCQVRLGYSSTVQHLPSMGSERTIPSTAIEGTEDRRRGKSTARY